MSRYRFPGLRSFEENDAAIFNGRSKEKQLLFDLIMVERVVVLFAKSGAGKTSLLRAGIVPMLADRPYQPVLIRLNRREQLLHEQMFGQIAQVFGIVAKPEQTLWEYLQTINAHTGNITPVLFFDQFEEIFTLYDTAALREELIVQLADLINETLPNIVRQRLQNRRGELPASQLLAMEKPPRAKVVFSIRSDQLSCLHDLSDRIPGILRNRFELKGLRREQASEAILRPATLPDSRFDCAPFSFEPQALQGILDHLGSSVAGEVGGEAIIESFQLQLVCSHLEMKMLEQQGQGLSPLLVRAQTYGGSAGLDRLLAGFYQDTIRQIGDPAQQYNARRFIEDALILNERRVIMAEAVATGGEFPVRPEVLQLLVNMRLLRREERPGQGNYYELVHDTLLKPVLQFKRERDLQVAAEKARLERDAEARKRRKVAFYAGIVAVLALVAFVAFIRAWRQEQKTRFSFLYTAAQLQAEQNPTLAFRLAEEALDIEPRNLRAQGMLVRTFYGQLFAEGDTFYATPHYREFAAQWAKPAGKNGVLMLDSDLHRLHIQHPDSATGRTLTIREVGPVIDADLSPDGRWLVSVHRQDSLARLWQFADGSLVREIVHQGPVHSVAWSSDGRFFTTNAADNSQRLWDAAGKPVARYENKATADLLSGCAFSPDAGQLAVLKNDSTLCLYEPPSGTASACFAQTEGAVIVQAAYSPNGRYLAILAQHPLTGASSVTLIDRQGNRLFSHTTVRPSRAITGALPDNDGKRILVGRKDSLAGWLCGVQDSIQVLGRPFDQHRGLVSRVGLSDNAAYILTAGSDKSVKLWNRENRLLLSLPQPEKIERTFFSSDSRYVIMNTSNGKVRFWQLKKTPIAQLPVSNASQIFIEPLFGHIATLDRERQWGFWDLTGKPEPKPGWISDSLADAKPWGDGNSLLARLQQNKYAKWDIRSGQHRPLPAEKGRVTATAARADVFALQLADSVVEIWTTDSQRVALLRVSGKKTEQVALSPEGGFAAVVFRGRPETAGNEPLYEVRITNLKTGQSEVVASGEKPYILDFSPLGGVLRLGIDDAFWEWDIRQHLLRPLSGRRPDGVSAITALIHSPDGRWVATVAEDRTLSLWSHDGHWLHTFSCGRSRPNFVRFSPDGRYLLFEYHWPSRNKQALIIPLDPAELRSAFDKNLFYSFPQGALTNKQSSFINQ